MTEDVKAPIPGPVNRDALRDLYHVIQQPHRRPDAVRIAFTRFLEQERIALDHSALLRVAAAWSHEDDWRVEQISVDLLRDLADALARGTDAELLAEHAQHRLVDCGAKGCGGIL